MPTPKTSSDLFEVEFTPQELNTAMQFMDKTMSIMYLQNLRVAIFRQVVSMEFNSPDKDTEQFRQHAYLKGKLDLIFELLDGAFNPVSVVNQESSPDNQSSLL